MVSVKGRRPLVVYGSMRATYTKDDVLLEDFFEQEDHPYALYDLNGNVKETNLDCEKPMLSFYEWVIKAALYIIGEEY